MIELLKKFPKYFADFIMWYFRGHDEKFARRGVALFIIGLLLIPASMYVYTFVARAQYQRTNNIPPFSSLASSPAPKPSTMPENDGGLPIAGPPAPHRTHR